MKTKQRKQRRTWNYAKLLERIYEKAPRVFKEERFREHAEQSRRDEKRKERRRNVKELLEPACWLAG